MVTEMTREVEVLAQIFERALESAQGGQTGKGRNVGTRHRRVSELLDASLQYQEQEHAKGNLRPHSLADYTRVNAKLRAGLPNVDVPDLTL